MDASNRGFVLKTTGLSIKFLGLGEYATDIISVLF